MIPLDIEKEVQGFFTRGTEVHLRGYDSIDTALCIATAQNDPTDRPHLLFIKYIDNKPTIVSDLTFLNLSLTELTSQLSEIPQDYTGPKAYSTPNQSQRDLTRTVLHPHLFETWNHLLAIPARDVVEDLKTTHPSLSKKLINPQKSILSIFQKAGECKLLNERTSTDRGIKFFTTLGDFNSTVQQLIGEALVTVEGNKICMRKETVTRGTGETERTVISEASIDVSEIESAYIVKMPPIDAVYQGKRMVTEDIWTLKTFDKNGHEIFSCSGFPSSNLDIHAFSDICLSMPVNT